MDAPGTALFQFLVDAPRRFLKRRRPFAVAATEHRIIYTGERFTAVQPFDEFDGVDLGPRNDGRVVARMELRAGCLCEFARAGRVLVGHRQEFDRGMLGREARAKAADAPRADYGNSEFLAFDGGFLPRVILAGDLVST